MHGSENGSSMKTTAVAAPACKFFSRNVTLLIGSNLLDKQANGVSALMGDAEGDFVTSYVLATPQIAPVIRICLAV